MNNTSVISIKKDINSTLNIELGSNIHVKIYPLYKEYAVNPRGLEHEYYNNVINSIADIMAKCDIQCSISNNIMECVFFNTCMFYAQFAVSYCAMTYMKINN